MYTALLILASGLLGFGNALVTVTVSVNTGVCPASYSSSFDPATSTSGSSFASSVLTSSTQSSLATSSAATSSVATSSFSSSSSASSISVSSSISSASAGPSAAPCPCPQDNNQLIFDSQALDYQITCDESLQVLQYAGATYQATLDGCMVACDYYVDANGACTGAAYLPSDPEGGFNCFLSTDNGPATTGLLSACLALVPT